MYYNNISLILLPFISVFINNFNAIYFCDKIIGNYYIVNEKYNKFN